MLKSQKSCTRVGSDWLTPPAILQSRRERVCDTVCDLHECVISGCASAEAAGYLMDRLLSLEPRYTSQLR